MQSMEYKVNPLWQFLSENYNFEEAFNIFGPYAGANIKVRVIDKRTVESSMTLVLTNTNYVGSHFGGSLYSMCDPFFMFLLMANLGSEYIVWDKSASIDFLRPARGTVKALFHIPSDEIERIKSVVDRQRKMDWETSCEVLAEDGKPVASLKKVLYIRRQRQRGPVP